MTQQFGKHVFDQAGKLFKDAVVQKNFQALSENAVAASKGFYDQVTAAGLEQTKVLTDIADTAWDSTKMLNEKVAQNVISSIEAIFAGVQLMAGAKSLPEIAKLQREFVQKFAAQSMQQTTELFDLSTRASQHVLERSRTTARTRRRSRWNSAAGRRGPRPSVESVELTVAGLDELSAARAQCVAIVQATGHKRRGPRGSSRRRLARPQYAR